jgi:mono/diheme cytochrome c family protein
MPPFATVLNDADIAAVLSHARHAWGQQAPAVSPLQVQRYRGSVRP